MTDNHNYNLYIYIYICIFTYIYIRTPRPSKTSSLYIILQTHNTTLSLSLRQSSSKFPLDSSFFSNQHLDYMQTRQTIRYKVWTSYQDFYSAQFVGNQKEKETNEFLWVGASISYHSREFFFPRKLVLLLI